MATKLKNKKEIIDKYKIHETDVGSAEVQVAILSERIKKLSEHLKKHKKDNHTRFGLLKIVSRRKKMLHYLRNKNVDKYQDLIKSLRESK
ncbi:30S ribosomal protein S15 [Candidatus Margulisiibacteriota bacterium]